ncbi:hypothetical protein CBR_g12940 [Chara braunii]|uniref:Uncharacterized protein n=1 Tax=Chara braunii TaxID=69332 RepID=A0A388KTG3_CHABU|nr:hypothetical protein CBR_g12940 [Chara braunii]|eukprot:GBG73223.1 hypothetical protein CBR_g12940 [Chara braunii]
MALAFASWGRGGAWGLCKKSSRQRVDNGEYIGGLGGGQEPRRRVLVWCRGGGMIQEDVVVAMALAFASWGRGGAWGLCKKSSRQRVDNGEYIAAGRSRGDGCLSGAVVGVENGSCLWKAGPTGSCLWKAGPTGSCLWKAGPTGSCLCKAGPEEFRECLSHPFSCD